MFSTLTRIYDYLRDDAVELVRVARSPAALRRKAGRKERRALRVRSERRRDRLNAQAAQLKRQATELEKRIAERG